MGKDTGSNRKSGRAGAGGAGGTDLGAGGQQAGVPAAATLDAGQTKAFSNSFAKSVFGTTNAKKLREDHGVAMKVNGDGTLDVTAYGWLTSSAVASLNTRQGWLNNFAVSNGFSLSQIGETGTMLGQNDKVSSTATRRFKIVQG